MATMDNTVPRPPADTGWIQTEDPNNSSPVDWSGLFVAVLIGIMVAVPVVVAFVVGFADRCVRLLVAATVEAYLSGRGIAND